jgi:N-acetyl-beta-hexosaminidase
MTAVCAGEPKDLKRQPQTTINKSKNMRPALQVMFLNTNKKHMMQKKKKKKLQGWQDSLVGKGLAVKMDY